MFIRLKDVPRDERHLLFCSKLAGPSSRSRRGSSAIQLAAINRSRRAVDEGVDATWPAVFADSAAARC